MPIKPEIKNLTATSVGILNTIRNNASAEYQSGVPLAENTTQSIRQVGESIMGYQARTNEFLNALINRIGMVIINSKMYTNPWAVFKRGVLELGETVEEIFISIAEPFQFDPQVAEDEVLKRVIPDVKSQFHTLNYKKFYKVTVSNEQLRQAFLSWTGITDLISRIIQTLYSGAEYDEFITLKYMVARLALDGKIKSVSIPAVSELTAKSIVSTIKSKSNDFSFMSNEYNMANVKNHSQKLNQYLIKTNKFDAIVDVEVLALSFNLDKAEFSGRQILIDGFDKTDDDRLAILFEYDSSYIPFTAEEKLLLSSIEAILLDESWFMIFDNLNTFTEQYNSQGLYRNYFYHVWKIFSASPFANAALFSSLNNEIISMTVNPSSINLSVNSQTKFNVDITSNGFVSFDVNWNISGNESTDTFINNFGILSIANDETASTLIVTATSLYDNTKTANATVTII